MAENADDIELEDLDRERETQRANEEEETSLPTTDPVTRAFSLSTDRIRFLLGWTTMDRRRPKFPTLDVMPVL